MVACDIGYSIFRNSSKPSRTTAGADRRRNLPEFNVSDAEGFEQELERALNRELDSVADELLTLLELDRATAMVAFPLEYDASSTNSRGTNGGHQLPLIPAEDQDQELIAALLDKPEFGRASTTAPTNAESPSPAATAEEAERRFGGRSGATFAVRTNKRHTRRHYTSRRRTQSRRSHKSRIVRKRGRVGGCTIHHRGIAERPSSTFGFSASDQAESRSAAAEALRRHPPHRSRPARASHGDHGSRGGATRAKARGPQSPAATTSVGGCGRCCCGGGCCGAGRRVSGADGIESPPRQGYYGGLSSFVLRRRARGVLVSAALLAPLSMVVTGRERRWPLVLLFAPLMHALVSWVGVTLRPADRATIDRLLGAAKIGVVIALFVAVYSFVMVVTQPLSRLEEGRKR